MIQNSIELEYSIKQHDIKWVKQVSSYYKAQFASFFYLLD